MKLFLVERTDPVDWDEYDSLVIRAYNKEHALDIASKTDDEYSAYSDRIYVRAVYLGMGNRESLTATEITYEGEPGVILGSFNAG